MFFYVILGDLFRNSSLLFRINIKLSAYMNQSVSTKHPKGLFVLFFTEMWERFSYYGMRAILVLYIINGLRFDDEYAQNSVYGSYTGLVYLTPLLGGYIADKFWGNRKSIITGGLLMAIGQFILFFSASNYQDQGLANVLMWVGLCFVILGNGFFKPNISTMVGQLYNAGDKRLDAAFTIFYMGINLGSFIGPIICGGLAEKYDDANVALQQYFKWGFLAAGIAMIIGTLNFLWLKNKYIVAPDGHQLGVVPNAKIKRLDGSIQEEIKISEKSLGIWIVIAAVLFLIWRSQGIDLVGCLIFSLPVAICGLIITDPSLTKIEKGKIAVIFTAVFFVIFFWAAFEQGGSSLTLFAERDTDRSITINTKLGYVIFFILGVFSLLYMFLRKIMEIPKEHNLLFTALGIGGLAYGIYNLVIDVPYVLPEIPASWFNSVNGLFIILLAPVISQFWGFLGKKKIEPSSPKKQALGLLFLALGYLVIAIGVKDVTTKVSMFWLISLYGLHTIGEICLSPIGMSLVSQLAPIRFLSLLMGVWFLSNAVASKLAGTLSTLKPDAGPKDFLGYEITNNYDFFMLFVVMGAAAAAILFVCSFWMEKRMKDQ